MCFVLCGGEDSKGSVDIYNVGSEKMITLFNSYFYTIISTCMKFLRFLHIISLFFWFVCLLMDIVPSYSKLKSERFKTALKVVRTYGKTCRNSMTRQFIILMR